MPRPIHVSSSSRGRAHCRPRRARPRRPTCARVPLRRIDGRMTRALMKLSHLILAAWLIALAIGTPAHADAAFDAWVQSVWPEAQNLGVSRATFDTAARGLEPDLSLPDLAI